MEIDTQREKETTNKKQTQNINNKTTRLPVPAHRLHVGLPPLAHGGALLHGHADDLHPGPEELLGRPVVLFVLLLVAAS